jgi:ribosomal protein S18 acetylase RimI-like enzyme
MAEQTRLIGLRRITEDDAELVAQFMASIPGGDQVFFKEAIDIEAVRRWSRDDVTLRWLLVGEDGKPQAYLALIPGMGWSAHVGELGLVVGEGYRRQGIGRALARIGLLEGLRLGLQKLTVEVVADKEGDLQMFTSIGFEPEAVLKNQIIDRNGDVHDLVLLAHDVEAVRDDMQLIGIEQAFGQPGPP